jgi:hypothetical protein
MNYREINALNQSILKKILNSPQEFVKAKRKQETREESVGDHFLFGSIVDLMLTGSKKEFDEKYAVIDDNVSCTEAVKAIVDGVFLDYLDLEDNDFLTLESLQASVLQNCRYQNYQSKWKDETKVTKIIELGSEYFEILKTTKGKTVVSQTEYAKAVNCKAALQVDQFTREFVVEKSKPNREFLDKFIIEFEWQGHKIKGELDRVVIDHDAKTITPIDFKTTGKSVNNFVSDFWYYRYDFQAAVYHRGIMLSDNAFIEKLISAGYKLKDFLYIVVEKNLSNPPMVFNISGKVIDLGFSGGTLSNGKQLDGFEQAIMRYEFAISNDAWNYPMEYYDNGGSIFVEP